MKKTLIVLALLLGSSTALANSYPNPISPQDAKTWVEVGKAVMIDVREKGEVSQGMAEPAYWYAKSSIDSNLEQFLTDLGQYAGKEIILYCRSGHRASIVVEALAGRGIHAWNMGGYADWVAAGFATKLPTVEVGEYFEAEGVAAE